MNITIVPGKAEEDVREIELIIDNIDKSMQELDEIIRRLIPERLETEWSNSLKETGLHTITIVYKGQWKV